MKRPAFIYVLIILTSTCISAKLPDERKFSYINVENGLRSNSVECIFQDRNGMIWFGTHDGLTMYDTYQLKTYRHDPENPYSLGDNCVYDIFEDTEGQLWIGTERGIYIFDRNSEQFRTPADGTEISDVQVHSIAEDNMGNIWIATLGDGVYQYSPSSGSLENWKHDPSRSDGLSSDYSPKILVDAVGNIWCLTSGSYLYRFDKSENDFTPILIKDYVKDITEQNVFSMCLDWEGNIWLAGWNSGIFHYNIKTGVFRNYLTKSGNPRLKGRIHTINELEPGNIYIGSDHGMSIFNLESSGLETISYGSPIYRQLSDNFVYDILKDREGGLWIATYFGGVNYSNPNSTNFIFRKCSPESFTGRIISKFCENHDGKIWIGTDDGGLFLYDPEKDRCRPVSVDKNIPDLNIHALLAVNNNLWIGTYSNGLYRMNLDTGEISHDPIFSPDEPMPQSIYSLYNDHTGKLWIGTKTAIWSWTKDTGYTCIRQLGYNSDIIDIKSDTSGNIYFASISKGLFRYNPKTGVLQKVAADEVGCRIPDAIMSLGIYQNNILIGTTGRGLVKYDINTGIASNVPIPDLNITNISVFHIINDESNIWLSTNEGLLRYSPGAGMRNIFGRKDGLRTDIFSCNSGIKASDGRIYLGTNDGFNIFNPKSISSNMVAPNTVFTDPRLNSLKSNDTYTLRKGHSPFTIEFAALSYISPQKNRYRYMMEGLQDNWTEVPWKNNRVTFSGLRCGTYTFRVSSCNNDGIWGEPVSVPIVVKPYWYNGKAAISLYIMAGICASICIILILRAYNIQKKKSRSAKIQYIKEKTRIETELQFFTNLAHEIRTPVMLINAPANEISAMTDIPQKVKDNISYIKKSSEKLLNLTTEILDFRKCTRDMTLSPHPIIQLTRQITDEFAIVAHSHGIKLRFTDKTDGNIMANLNPEAWNKIVSNLLSNAIKFTRDVIEVSAGISDGRLSISVSDNGTGIAESEQKNIFNAFWRYDNSSRLITTQGFGLGLSIVSMLVHKMGMGISVESKPEEYTIFTVTVPLDSEEPDYSSNDGTVLPAISGNDNTGIDRKTAGPDMLPQSHEIQKDLTIMIVDDDDDLRLYLEDSLSDCFSTISAHDGTEAIEMLRSGKHADIIISDVIMPRMNGIELCNSLKKDINLSHIPVVLLSANSDTELKMQSISNGSDAYIDKPVDITYLKTLINSILEKRKALWETFSKRPFLVLSSILNKGIEDKFLKEFSDFVLDNMSMTGLNIDYIADKMHTSRTVLFQKVKESAGMTPNNLIKELRLIKAAELLAQEKYKINEICWMVGFNTPSYFSKCFLEHFGVYPKDFNARNGDIVSTRQ